MKHAANISLCIRLRTLIPSCHPSLVSHQLQNLQTSHAHYTRHSAPPVHLHVLWRQTFCVSLTRSSTPETNMRVSALISTFAFLPTLGVASPVVPRDACEDEVFACFMPRVNKYCHELPRGLGRVQLLQRGCAQHLK